MKILICFLIFLWSEFAFAEGLSGNWVMLRPNEGTPYASLIMEQTGNSVKGEFTHHTKEFKVPFTGSLENQELRLTMEMFKLDTSTAKKLWPKMPEEFFKFLVDAGFYELFVFSNVNPDDKELKGKFFTFWYQHGTEATGVFSQKYVLRDFANAGTPKAIEKLGTPTKIYTLRRKDGVQ